MATNNTVEKTTVTYKLFWVCHTPKVLKGKRTTTCYRRVLEGRLGPAWAAASGADEEYAASCAVGAGLNFAGRSSPFRNAMHTLAMFSEPTWSRSKY